MRLGFGGPLLFDGITLQIEQGERVCILGRNGEGKTTLLNIIKGSVIPDQGEIYRQHGLRITLLEQEIPSTLEGPVIDIAAGIEVPDVPITDVENSADEEERWQRQVHVKKMLTKLNLNPELDFKTLSTGMMRRTLIAGSMAGSPDVLLLDEPTNHMDIESIGMIEELLLKFNGTIIFITHDRRFLQKIATRIIEIDRAKIMSWSCSYEKYLKEKDELIEIEFRQNHRFDKKLEKEETWVRQGLKARRARNEGRVRALMQMREERRKRRNLSGKMNMQIQEADRTGKLVIEAKGVSFDYNETPVLKDFAVTILRGDRVGIIGPNGSGKTTLLSLLLKHFPAGKGSIRHGVNLQISYFDQVRETLDPEKTVQESVGEGNDIIVVNGRRKHVVGYLKDFLFSPDRARSPVKTLSGGEKNRLLLARLFTRPSNLLIMDEPTNDLDIQTLELLESLLVEYSGTLLLVSHDRAFLNNVITSTLVFEGNGNVNEYIGGYDDWVCHKREKQISQKQLKKSFEKKTSFSSVKDKKLGFMEKRELSTLPEKIEAMEKEQEILFAMMAEPDFYRKNGDEIAGTRARQQELAGLLEVAYERWEELEGRNM